MLLLLLLAGVAWLTGCWPGPGTLLNSQKPGGCNEALLLSWLGWLLCCCGPWPMKTLTPSSTGGCLETSLLLPLLLALLPCFCLLLLRRLLLTLLVPCSCLLLLLPLPVACWLRTLLEEKPND